MDLPQGRTDTAKAVSFEARGRQNILGNSAQSCPPSGRYGEWSPSLPGSLPLSVEVEVEVARDPPWDPHRCLSSSGSKYGCRFACLLQHTWG